MIDMKWIERILIVLLAWFLASPVTSHAQMAGNKAVYDASGTNCPPCLPSTASVDASVVTGSDICQQIYNALQSIPGGPKVVDARGITTAASCSSSETPWLKSGIYLNQASTVLLPAGTITVSSSWILPNGTRLMGTQTATGGPGTTLLASGLSNNSAIIQFGDGHCGSTPCTGITVENLTLDGNGATNIIGILNQNSQFQSYVDHVSLYQILGTGLKISGSSASNSGPYSNITFDTGTFAGASGTVCAQINGLTGTRGLHDITCISRLNNAFNGILLDASNNSLEDVRIMGFDNGVLIGSLASAHGNVLFNIYGDTSPQSGPVVNVIDISGSTVSDLAIMGVANAGGPGTLTIRDNLTRTFLVDPVVAMYSLGRPGQGGAGFSRFTTSPNEASWSVGAGSPAPSTCTAQNRGSLYSNTSSSGGLLWVCENANPLWQQVE
jgi:hypothetical protein